MRKGFRFAAPVKDGCEGVDEVDFSRGGEVIVYMLAGVLGGIAGAGLALGFKLSLGWIFVAYSLGGVALVMAAVLVRGFGRSVRRSAAAAMARNRPGYPRGD
ncbi:hypothetical protein SAMN05421641_10689 [Paracoccus thiocyanatus]|uniref:Uncharacterized protein n=1 Tax=Paracoccus thiocyanatus TaxID=34006 RepID=A0A1N6RU73_9RHOB|nr:hypothetical protein [Paracoccus thiocyanatus]SIQ32368.1 hypothetical protein SAMN05421641_10689 [Paracoccus thiocyanatus]